MYCNPHGIGINTLPPVCRATGDRRPVLWKKKKESKYSLTLLVDDQFLREVSWEKSLLIAFMKAFLA